MFKLRNIIILIIIAAIIILSYVYFVGNQEEEGSLVSSDVPTLPVTTSTNANIADVDLKAGDNDALSQSFLSLLLGVKSITLDDSIFKNGSAFFTLVDSSITLTQDGTEGRVNPFAPIGTDINTIPATPDTQSVTPPTGATSGATTSTGTTNKPN
ncbi:MAG: hypothetical protein WC783_04560 [Candidatus Paceibacterota bacterium]|jgi:hypothetical protein